MLDLIVAVVLLLRSDHCCLQTEEEGSGEHFQGETFILCNVCLDSHVEAIAVAVQDDLVELYAGNNNDSKMKTKNANVNQAVNGILVSSV